MLLIYFDETGKDYELLPDQTFYKSGPFATWIALLIDEKKYFHLERIYLELVKKILGNSYVGEEIHGHKLWIESNTDYRRKKVKEYFEELFQLVSKLALSFTVGIGEKPFMTNGSDLASNSNQRKNLQHIKYAFIHGLEYKLAELNETGVLIADESEDTSMADLKTILKHKTSWHHSPSSSVNPLVSDRYYFESKSSFLLDQIHFVKSDDSTFIQIVDCIGYVLNRMLTYYYLMFLPGGGKPIPDINKTPITESTFNLFLFRTKPSFVFYDWHHDVMDVNFFLIDGKLKIEDFIKQINSSQFTG